MFCFSDLGAYQSCEISVDLIPARPGKRQVLVSFDAKELNDLTSMAEVEVTGELPQAQEQAQAADQQV